METQEVSYMKKRMACICMRVGKYAKQEVESEVKKILKKRGVKPERVKKAAKRVAMHGMKVAREMQNIAMKEMSIAIRTAKTVKRKTKKKVKRKIKKKK